MLKLDLKDLRPRIVSEWAEKNVTLVDFCKESWHDIHPGFITFYEELKQLHIDGKEPIKKLLLDGLDRSYLKFVNPLTGKEAKITSAVHPSAYKLADNIFLSFFGPWKNDFTSFQVYFLKSKEVLFFNLFEDGAETFVGLNIFKKSIYRGVGELEVLLAKFELNDASPNGSLCSFGKFDHIGHSIWNNLSAIPNISKMNVSKIKVASYQTPFGEIKEISKKLIPEKREIEYLDFEHPWEAFEYAVNNKLFFVTLKNDYISLRTSEAVVSVIENKLLPSNFNSFLNEHDGKKLIVFSLRVGNRYLLNQEEVYIASINRLLNEFEDAYVVIDGMNSSSVSDLSTHRNIALDEEVLIAQSIILKTDVSRVTSLVGCGLHENILLLSKAKLVISTWGAGLVKSHWVNRVPGFIHSSNNVYHFKPDFNIYFSNKFVENPSKNYFFHGEGVVDIVDEDDLFRTNYKIESEKFSSELINFASVLFGGEGYGF